MFPENPFPGPHHLTVESAASFFGRRPEVRQLVDRVQTDRIVLVFAETGAGKSSLVEAGLIPELKEAGYRVPDRPFRPASLLDEGTGEAVRFGPREVIAGIARCFGPAGQADPPTDGSQLYQTVFAGVEPAPLLVAIDQTEEIFTRTAGMPEAPSILFRALGELSHHRDIWLVIVVREDFLARTLSFSHFFVGYLDSRYDVPLLTLSAAREVIVKTLGSSSEELEPGLHSVVEQIQAASADGLQKSGSFLAEGGPRILPLFLQVICRSWYDDALQRAGRPAEGGAGGVETEAVLGYLRDHQPQPALAEDAVQAFVDQAFRAAVERAERQVSPLETEDVLREFCEENLIERGFRRICSFPEPAPAGLQQLCKGYFIADSPGPKNRIELSHDRFVEALVASNNRWFAIHAGFISRRRRAWSLGGKATGLLLSLWEMARALPSRSSWSVRDLDFFKKSALRPVNIGTFLFLFIMAAGILLVLSERAQRQVQEAHAGLQARTIELQQAIADLNETKDLNQQQIRLQSSRLDAQRHAQQSNFIARSLRNTELGLAQALFAWKSLNDSLCLIGGSDNKSKDALQAKALVTSALLTRTLEDRMVRRRVVAPEVRRRVKEWGFDAGGRLCSRRPGERPVPKASLPPYADACRAPVSIGVKLDNGNSIELPATAFEAIAGGPFPGSKELAVLRRGERKVRLLPKKLHSWNEASDSGAGRFGALVRSAGATRGVTILESGTAVLWSVIDQDLEGCDGTAEECRVIEVQDEVERAVGGPPVEVWLDAGPVFRVRILTELGDWVEIASSTPSTGHADDQALASCELGNFLKSGETMRDASAAGEMAAIAVEAAGKSFFYLCDKVPGECRVEPGTCQQFSLPEDWGRFTAIALSPFLEPQRGRVAALVAATETGALLLNAVNRNSGGALEVGPFKAITAHVGPVADLAFEDAPEEGRLLLASVGQADGGIFVYEILDPEENLIVGPINLLRHKSSLHSARFVGSRLRVEGEGDFHSHFDLGSADVERRACQKFEGLYPSIEGEDLSIEDYCRGVLSGGSG